MITNSIRRELEKAKKRKWDKIYVAIDLHQTVLIPDWDNEILSVDYYPYAKEMLQYLTNRNDVIMIMFTCSHPYQIEHYEKEFLKDGIKFDYVNSNPEVATDERYGYYKDKFYFNVLMDDKAGFEPKYIPDIINEFKKMTLI